VIIIYAGGTTMAKRTKKQHVSKWDVLVSSSSDIIYIGIDVHKKSYHIAIWKNGQLVNTIVMAHDDMQLIKKLLIAGPALKLVVYEAGPTGYGLARAVLAAGIECHIVAPGKTPQASNKGNKSDKVDCRRLAEYAYKGILGYVSIPTAEEDSQRQMIRARDDMKKKRRRIMQQIKGFLLYNSIPEPEGLVNWSHASVCALSEIELPFQLHFRLIEHLNEFDYYNKSLKRLEKELKKYEKEHSVEMEILQSHPGIGHITARQFLAEIYRLNRFPNSKKLTSYIGLAPRISQSGETRHEHGVIKGGCPELRGMLIECCWRWISTDKKAKERYNRYCSNTGSGKKSIQAMARCLVVNLWNMSIKKEKYKTAA
jgi:transposase